MNPIKPENSTTYPILIVEDDEVSLQMLEKALKFQGFEVFCANNGQEALNCFKDRFFPIVLTDWMMPEIDGIDLIREIRAKEASSFSSKIDPEPNWPRLKKSVLFYLLRDISA